MVLPDDARALLQMAVIVRMAVTDANGYPHVVPVWFGLDGDDIIIFGFRNTRKVDYIQANPKGSVQIGGDPAGNGYLIKGDFSIEADDNHHWARAITYAYETRETAEKNLAEWTQQELVVLRLVVNKIVRV